MFLCMAHHKRSQHCHIVHIAKACTEDLHAWMHRSRDIPDLHKDRSLKKLVGFDAKKFSQAPAHAMHAALQHLRCRYGGTRRYLAEACGFSLKEQQLLAKGLRTGVSLM